MAGLLMLAAVVILALVGVWHRLCGKLMLGVDRFTFDDQELDRAPPIAIIPGAGKDKKEPTASSEPPPPPLRPSGEFRAAPSPYAIWRLRPVFLTSTFQDFHAERDLLRRVFFPAREERLQARHLVPIDLRCGVETGDLTQEHAKERLILKVCLAEIKRSRPFLIGLLGDRYGKTSRKITKIRGTLGL